MTSSDPVRIADLPEGIRQRVLTENADPPFQLFPPLDKRDLEELRESIRARGVRVPLEIDSEGRILDGHHRLQVAQQLELPTSEIPVTVREDLEDEEDVLEYVLEVNIGRRHLTPADRQVVAGELRDRGWSLRRIGNRLGVSHETIRRDLQEVGVTNVTGGAAERSPDRVEGRDGKNYPASDSATADSRSSRGNTTSPNRSDADEISGEVEEAVQAELEADGFPVPTGPQAGALAMLPRGKWVKAWRDAVKESIHQAQTHDELRRVRRDGADAAVVRTVVSRHLGPQEPDAAPGPGCDGGHAAASRSSNPSPASSKSSRPGDNSGARGSGSIRSRTSDSSIGASAGGTGGRSPSPPPPSSRGGSRPKRRPNGDRGSDPDRDPRLDLLDEADDALARAVEETPEREAGLRAKLEKLADQCATLKMEIADVEGAWRP